MERRWIPVVSALALMTGCAHVSRVGRPPSQDEVEEINQSAGQAPSAMTLRYVDPQNPCAGGTCSVEGPRPIIDSPPFGIERITEVDAKQMTVVAETGDVWHLDLSQLAGVTTRRPATFSGGVAGGAVALGITGPLMLFLYESYGAWPDSPVNSYGLAAQKTPWPYVGATAVFTLIGAVIGAVIGHSSLTTQTFDFGGGHLIPSSSFSR